MIPSLSAVSPPEGRWFGRSRLAPSPPFWIFDRQRCLGSTAPFTAADNHALNYKSGMLQSWNKFCYTSGYIEVSVVLPGANENAQGYVSTHPFPISSRPAVVLG